MPRRFGQQFWEDEDFTLNNAVQLPDGSTGLLMEGDEGFRKAITDTQMMRDVSEEILRNAAEGNPIRGVTGPGSVGPTTMGGRSELIPMEELVETKAASAFDIMDDVTKGLQKDYLEHTIESADNELDIAKSVMDTAHAATRGMLGAEEWWAGHMHGDQHVPRDPAYGHTPIIPNPARVTLQDIDPHTINTDTTAEGHALNIVKWGMPSSTPEDLVRTLLERAPDEGFAVE
jgi:hypothetical protein